MDEAPPSYETATAREWLPLMTPYLRKRDLVVASRVCGKWNKVFGEVVWASPERMWSSRTEGSGSRSGFNGFLNFLRTLNRLPQSSRARTTHHTKILNLHSSPSTLYTVFEPTWLSALLSNLPHLTTLTVTNASYFDHATLRSFAQSPPPHCTYTLTTLVLHDCPNTTAASLDIFLRVGWPVLEHLDVSKTVGGGGKKVLFGVAVGRALPRVKRLVVRECQVGDEEVGVIARGMGTRLEMLDVRGNLVGDKGVADLVGYCVLPPEYDVAGGEVAGMAKGMGGVGGNSGAGGGGGGPAPPSFDEAVGAGAGTGYEKRTGLTRLLISGNPKVSWAAMEGLIKTTRLVNLDCGMVAELDKEVGVKGHGARIPTFVLSMYGFKYLRSLRIDFRLVCPPVRSGIVDVGKGKAGVVGGGKNGGHVQQGEGEEEQEGKDRLRPETMPNLKTLVLCGVPYYASPATMVVENLLRFLQDLAAAEGRARRLEREREGGEEGRMVGRFMGMQVHYLRLLVLEMRALTVAEEGSGGKVDLGMYSSRPGDGTGDGGAGSSGDDDDDDDDDDSNDDDEDGDFSFFTGGGEREGFGGDWGDSYKKPPGNKGKDKEKEKERRRMEKPRNVLAEVIAWRRKAEMVWPGELKVVKDVGWDDEGGVENGSGGRLKWGVVVDEL